MLKRVNSLSNNINENEIEILKRKYNLRDSFELGLDPKTNIKSILSYTFTTWTNTVVDYILFTSEWSPDTIIYPYIYFTDASDHCPIYVDISFNFITPHPQQINTLSNQTGGSYRDKYIKYKSKYLHAKKLQK